MKQNTPDLLRPSNLKSSITYAHSLHVWRRLYRKSRNASFLPQHCLEIHNLLNLTPAIPKNDISETADQNTLCLQGFSQWRITSEKNCELDEELKSSHPQKAIIGVLQPTACRVSDEFFPTWNAPDGIEDASSRQCNYLCPLILGWSYILSTHLVELRKHRSGDGMKYTAISALWEEHSMPSSSRSFSLALGDVDQCELRWWAAILARGRGWKAQLLRSEREFSPPWACYLDDDVSFTLTYSMKDDVPLSKSESPPSSSQALKYLYRFASLHGVTDQLIAAFASSLTLPTHVRFGAPVILPTPIIIKPQPQNVQCDGHVENSTFAHLSDHLSRFMTISCVPNVLHSSLFSSCWEPGITCNLASEWLQPFFQVLDSLLEKNSYCSLITLLAARQPTLAPLWLGVGISGLLPRMIMIWKSYLPNTCPESSIWTQSSQSFIDCNYFRTPPLLDHDHIPREDEFRLLYLTDIDSTTYGPPPMSPYPPFGISTLKDASLQVQLHAKCGHKPKYTCWIWQETDTQHQFKDPGIPSPSIGTIKDKTPANNIRCLPRALAMWFMNLLRLRSNLSEALSERATRNLFSWLYFADGVRSDEQQMWNHDWLRIILGKENEEDEVSASQSPAPPSRNSIIHTISRTYWFNAFSRIQPPGSVPSGPPPG